MRRFLLLIFFIFTVSAGAFFLLKQENKIELTVPETKNKETITELPPNPEAEKALAGIISAAPVNKPKDLPPQEPMQNPPSTVKAVYITSWSAGTNSRIDYLIDLAKKTEINAVVIDIKDYSGYVAYDIGIEEVVKYGAKEIRIPMINSLIKKLHNENIYIIGRVTVFQDPALAKARPDLAIKNSITDAVWTDKKGLSWMDPASHEVWDYNIKIAKDAASRGFDEINFDYIRFPSDGDLEIMMYPFYNEIKLKQEVIKEFFAYLRSNLLDVKISADLFGLSTIKTDDMGIGQVIESAYSYFDYVSPMVYPSHYSSGFLGYKNPAEHPYEVVKYSMDSAFQRLKNYELGIMNNATTTNSTTTKTETNNSSFVIHNSKLRPWLQDFDLDADYGPEEIKAQIKAVYDSGVNNGWMLWNSGNVYTKEALAVE